MAASTSVLAGSSSMRRRRWSPPRRLSTEPTLSLWIAGKYLTWRIDERRSALHSYKAVICARISGLGHGRQLRFDHTAITGTNMDTP
jgi:hypothetical protein